MADYHRGTRRYDLHLTGPQVVGIVAGSLVVVGMAFGLGVGAGRMLAETPAEPRPAATVGSAPDAGSPKVDYSYQRELTRADPPPVAPPKAVAAPKPAVPATTVPVVTAAADGGTPPEAAPAVERAVAAASHVDSPPATGPEDKFAVQFGAPADSAVAEKLAGRLIGFGYSAYVVPIDIPSKGKFYRVRVGRFPSQDAAEALRDEAATQHKMWGMVMPSR
jgi:cell division septation protein DedD